MLSCVIRIICLILMGGSALLPIKRCSAQIGAGQVFQMTYTNSFGQIRTLNSVPTDLRPIDSKIYFSGNISTGLVQREPFMTAGTSATTVFLKAIRPGSGSDPAEFTKVGSFVYFAATDETNGRELWRTDGTPAGTVLVKNIRPGPSSSSPNNLVECQGKLLFSATDGLNGEELWVSDGTDAGTRMLFEIEPGTSGSGTYNPFNWNGVVYFAGHEGTNNVDFYRSDGTAAGTYKLVNMNISASGTYPKNFTVSNNQLFFSADTPAYSGASEIWKTNGTAVGTVVVKAIANTPFPAGWLTDVNGTLYFVDDKNSYGSGNELWKSDGTSGGTVQVANINVAGSSNPEYLTNYNGTLYFVADDGVRGRQIWKSNGTSTGTVMVHEIYNSVSSASPRPNSLFSLGGKLVFLQTRDGFGTEWWQTDGTPAGLSIIADISPGASSGPDDYYDERVVSGNSLYFIAGNNLWRIGALTPAQMLSPASGSLLTSSATTFTWDAGVGATQYAIWVGNSAGSYDLHARAVAGLSDTVTLPTDGRSLYVTLWSLINGAWSSRSYTYTAHTPGWQYTKLSQTGNASIGGKQTALPSSIYAYFNYYKGTDNKVWALYFGGGSWNQTALTSTANVSDWLTENTTYNQIYYKGTDNHIWALWYGAGRWNQAALTATANVSGDLQADSGTNFTYYKGTDNNLWVLWYGAGRWNQAPLTNSARVAGDVVVDRLNHFAYYRGTDSHMWVVWFGLGRWNEAKLSTTANVNKNLLVDPGWGTYYQDSSNATWAVWFTGTQWAQTNLGVSTGAVSGNSSRYGRLGIVYTGTDGAARYLGNNGSLWSISPIGPSGLNLRDTLNYKAPEGLIYARTADGNLGVFYYQ